MGDGQIFLKISAPHFFIKTYRMNLLFQPDPPRWTVPLSIFAEQHTYVTVFPLSQKVCASLDAGCQCQTVWPFLEEGKEMES